MTRLNITEAIQSKMQQSFLIQEHNEINRTIIYRCMASPKKQLCSGAEEVSLKIAIINADNCKAEMFLYKRRKQ